MPLEATMLVLDNSEYMRNGDYPATRFDAQVDATHIIFNTKTDSNPENSVGVMTAAGKGGPEVLVTHTRELGQIIQGAHDARKKMGGDADIPTAINVAQLALKHRQNKNLRQRIVLFLGSPPEGPGVDDKNLVKLAKKLKKNNIALDVIAFGDGIEEGETCLMKLLVDDANSGDNSHYVSIPPDPRRLLSDVIISSPILSADRGDRDAAMADITNTAGGSGGTFEEYGGIDPNLDPELAMVMRMSMEEERARQRVLQQASEPQQQGQQPATAAEASSAPAAGPSDSTPQPASTSASAATPASAPAPPVAMTTEDDDEEAALQEALRLSQQQQQVEDVEMADTTIVTGTAAGKTVQGGVEEEEEDEEAAIAKAIEMSMMPDSEQQQQEQEKK